MHVAIGSLVTIRKDFAIVMLDVEVSRKNIIERSFYESPTLLPQVSTERNPLFIYSYALIP